MHRIFMNEWIDHPLLKNMDPLKLELIKTAAGKTQGKSEADPVLLCAGDEGHHDGSKRAAALSLCLSRASMQRMLGLFLKFLEFQYTMKHFYGFGSEKSPSDALTALKDLMSPEEQKKRRAGMRTDRQ